MWLFRKLNLIYKSSFQPYSARKSNYFAMLLFVLFSAFLFNGFAQRCGDITVTFKPDTATGQYATICTSFNCIMTSVGRTQPNGNMNFGNDPVIYILSWTYTALGCPNGTSRTLLRFNELATIPIDAVITRAELKLYGLPASSGTGNSSYPGTPFPLSNQSFIQRITSVWNEKTVTWNTQPTTSTNSQITIPQSTTQWNWNFTDSSANLLAMVQDMVANPSQNFGFMFRLETEAVYRQLVFASNSNPDVALRPELTITYLRYSQTDTTMLNVTICEGNTYSENGFNEYQSGIYSIMRQNMFGCDSLVILNLDVQPPGDTIFISAAICNGEKYSENGFNEYISGNYVQNLQNRFGCDSIVCLNLTVNPSPEIEIISIVDNFCEQNFAQLQVITNAASFSWNTGSVEDKITVSESGVYSATAFINDCKKTAYYTIEECPCVIFVPNVFTPNGDGINEVFKPEISCYKTLKAYKMNIYDRWGSIIFRSTDYSIAWDGRTNKGKHCATGVYYCVIEYVNSKDEHFYKNTSVTLVR